MSESRPIFIVRTPILEPALVRDLQYILSKRILDYHVLVVPDSTIKVVQFECFNAPHTEMKFNNLKKYVTNIIEGKNEQTD